MLLLLLLLCICAYICTYIDLKNPKTNHKTAGFTPEEREDFSLLLKEGFVDVFRHLYPNTQHAYTYWSYRFNARAKNTGWCVSVRCVSVWCVCVYVGH